MIDNYMLSQFSLSNLREERSLHSLQYVNNRQFDYAMRDFAVIPYCLQHWAIHGIDLSEGFIHELWETHADKREDGKAGEILRVSKLVLDAFCGAWDIASISSHTMLQVLYRPDLDMRNVDIVVIDRGVSTKLQLRRKLTDDYQPIKARRRIIREPEERDVVALTAFTSDLDMSSQPYVPTDDWYRSVPTLIRNATVIDDLWDAA